MTLVGLDLNATRARAVTGPGRGMPGPLPLEAGRRELPLAVSLQNRAPVVGRAGALLARGMPHLACLDFLPSLANGRAWSAGRHRLDASAALGLACDHLAGAFGRSAGVVAALPAYLTHDQLNVFEAVARKSRWNWLASVPTPLAAALAAHEQLPWSGLALVGDVDGHALSWSAVAVEDDQLRLVHHQSVPTLSRRAWLGRLLDGASDRCIRQSRRDPRDVAETEQSLHDQLAAAIDEASPEARPIELTVQTAQWSQHLTLGRDELAGFCRPLARASLAELWEFQSVVSGYGPVAAVLLTAPAAGLPGLLTALREQVKTPAAPSSSATPPTDFGESLMLPAPAPTGSTVVALDPDAVAQAAHALASQVQVKALPPGPIDAIQLPRTRPPARPAPRPTEPARLVFQGEAYLLGDAAFTLGRDPACDLVFESNDYPSVSARHCEIVHEDDGHVLYDHSRHGTLVNDRKVTRPTPLQSGDWIRLGPNGPVLHFLGQPVATTAQ